MPNILGRQTARRKSPKTFWLKQLHTWHWMSSAISLIGLLLFAITGFTLNHAADIEAKPVVVTGEAQLPAPMLARVSPNGAADSKKPLPPSIADWIEQRFGENGNGIRVVERRNLSPVAAARRRWLDFHRSANGRCNERDHQSRMDQLSQRSSQGT
jgi:hypothetical protein